MRKLNLSVLAADTLTPLPNFDLIGEAHHVAVAVSGGPDSMALLLLTRAWAKAQVRQLTALHFDHGLRTESGAESLQVKAWCAERDITFISDNWGGVKPSTGIQAKARDARYAALIKLCKRINADVLLTGHTANDQAETILMRQKRSATAHALSGIWPERELNGIRIVRPMLGCTKSELVHYLVKQGQVWLEDPSNLNQKFERVRTRQALNLSDVAALNQLGADALSQHQAAQKISALWRSTLTRDVFGVVRFSLTDFSKLEVAVQDLCLIHVMNLAGRRDEVAGLERKNLLNWMAQEAGNQRTLNGLVFKRSKTVFQVFREYGRIDSVPQIVPESGELLWDRRFLVNAPKGATIVPLGVVLNFARCHDIPDAVQKTLPAVYMPDESVCVPHLGHGKGAQIVNKL